MAHAPRNSFLAPGVPRFSRSQINQKKAIYKKKLVAQPAKLDQDDLVKIQKVGGDKNGKTRQVAQKVSKYYPAEDVPAPVKCRKSNRPTKLRQSITPGTVLILLAGRFRGKRVVFLKQLASGLLLVSGPFKINGVPLKRVNQRYVIATSTQVDISGVSVDEKLCDQYFKKESSQKNKTEEEFFGAEGEVYPTLLMHSSVSHSKL
jgi:large subunit ribosomal protein L6e